MITPNGKEISIAVVPGTQHYKIHFTQGGELPVELTGLYTSYKKALMDVAVYLGKKTDKKKNDG